MMSRISSWIIIALVAVIAVLGFLYQGERVKTQSYKTEIEKINKKHADEQADLIAEVARINQENKETEVKWQRQIVIAQEKHKEEIHAIEAKYLNSLAANNRLRDTVSTLNSELSKYPRETVEKYAKTAANNLSECSAVTGDLERLAYQYNAEIELLLSSWPDSRTGSEHGYTNQDYGSGSGNPGGNPTIVENVSYRPTKGTVEDTH